MEIQLKEALAIFKAGGVYSLKVIAADLKRGTGGEILVFEKAKYALTESKKRGGGGKPPHKKNNTGALNIWDGKRGIIVKIHARLIVEFDGKAVNW